MNDSAAGDVVRKSLFLALLSVYLAPSTLAFELPNWTTDLAKTVNLEAAAPVLDFARDKGTELGGAAADFAAPAIDAAIQLPSGAQQAWVTATEKIPDSIGMPKPTTSEVAALLHIHQIQSSVGNWNVGQRYDAAQIALAAQFAGIPRDPNWWRDVSVSTAVVGVGTLGATAACSVVVSPAGPVAIALAGAGCGSAGASGGNYVLGRGYAFLNVTPDADAVQLGQGIGASMGTHGAFRLMRSSWLHLSSVNVQRASQLLTSGSLVEKASHFVDFGGMQPDIESKH